MSRPDLDGPVCLKHPDRLAIAHCSVCRKPLCFECVIERDGFKCCSEEHLKMAKESTRRSADVWDNRNRDERRRSTRSIAIWIVLILVALVIYLFRAQIMDTLGRIL